MAEYDVLWTNLDTGEVKERRRHGRDPVIWAARSQRNPSDEPAWLGEYEEYELTPLDLVLGLVPDLLAAMEGAVRDGKRLVVNVRTESRP